MLKTYSLTYATLLASRIPYSRYASGRLVECRCRVGLSDSALGARWRGHRTERCGGPRSTEHGRARTSFRLFGALFVWPLPPRFVCFIHVWLFHWTNNTVNGQWSMRDSFHLCRLRFALCRAFELCLAFVWPLFGSIGRVLTKFRVSPGSRRARGTVCAPAAARAPPGPGAPRPGR